MASLSEAHELALSAAYEDATPAPPGWKRKLIPRVAKGMIPSKIDVVFIAPDGEQVKSKSQLLRYLRVHRDGPAILEFNWNPEGETPRRSCRLTTKSPVKVELVSTKQTNSQSKAQSDSKSKAGKRKMPPDEPAKSLKQPKRAGKVPKAASKDRAQNDELLTDEWKSSHEQESDSVLLKKYKVDGNGNNKKLDDSEQEPAEQSKHGNDDKQETAEQSKHDYEDGDVKEASLSSLDKKTEEEQEPTHDSPKCVKPSEEIDGMENKVMVDATTNKEEQHLIEKNDSHDTTEACRGNEFVGSVSNGKEQQVIDKKDNHDVQKEPLVELVHSCENGFANHDNAQPAD